MAINKKKQYYPKIFVPQLVPIPQILSFDADRCALSEYISNILISA